MNVYIEYVVADNLVIDTLLLLAATVTLHIPYKKYRVFCGGAVGAACAVVSVYVTGFWSYLLKAACLVLMCIVTVGVGKKLFWHILLTAAYTFVLGGAIVALFNLFNVDYLTPSGEFYQMRVPLFVYVLAIFLVGFLCYSVIVYVKQVKKIAPHLVKIQLILDKNYALSGFVDSGNTLTHEGVPVCFVTKRFNGFTDYFARQTLLGKAVDIEVTTVTGSTKVKAIKGEIVCNGKARQVYLALPTSKCQTTYNVILSNEFCGGEV